MYRLEAEVFVRDRLRRLRQVALDGPAEAADGTGWVVAAAAFGYALALEKPFTIWTAPGGMTFAFGVGIACFFGGVLAWGMQDAPATWVRRIALAANALPLLSIVARIVAKMF